MKKYVLSIALLVASVGSYAQNRFVLKAQDLVNENKLEEAQPVITEALTSGKTKDMSLAWDVQGEIYQRIFAEELNKAAAKQPIDTAKFITNLYACIDAFDKSNSFDVKKEHVFKNKGNVRNFRIYLVYAGQFSFQNSKFEDAYKAYDTWLNYPQLYKTVADDQATLNDTTMERSQVAYYACLAAFQGKNYDKVMTHLEEALNYKEDAKSVRQVHLFTLISKGDTLQWVEASKKYATTDEAIAQNLMAYYMEKDKNAEALEFANSLLAVDPNNKIANYSKGVVLFGEEKFVEALPFFEKSVEVDPTFVDGYYNAGVCCCNEGYRVNEAIGQKKLTKVQYDKEIETVKSWYKKAEPFFLKIRELEPDNWAKWASRLKTVYYITGEKEKEAEMDKYL